MFADPRFVGGERSILIHSELLVLALFFGHLSIVVSFIGLVGCGMVTGADAFTLTGNCEDDGDGQKGDCDYFFHIVRILQNLSRKNTNLLQIKERGNNNFAIAV